MSQIALFVRHRARPGQRDAVRRIWEKHVQPRVRDNPGHQAYYLCYDDSDSDVIRVFQLYTNRAAAKDFLSGSWYAEYMREVSQFVATQPEIELAELIWTKG
jgi:quinol monooxygenase YgiN